MGIKELRDQWESWVVQDNREKMLGGLIQQEELEQVEKWLESGDLGLVEETGLRMAYELYNDKMDRLIEAEGALTRWIHDLRRSGMNGLRRRFRGKRPATGGSG